MLDREQRLGVGDQARSAALRQCRRGLAALNCCVATRHLVLQHGATACGTAQQVATSPSAPTQSSSIPRHAGYDGGWDGTCCMSEFAWPRLRCCCCCCAAEATDMSCAAAWCTDHHALRVSIHNAQVGWTTPKWDGRAFSDTVSTGRLGRIISASIGFSVIGEYCSK